MKKNMKEVHSKGLCHGCGTCVGMCPVSAVEISLDRRRGIYVPVVNDELCNECGLCLEACPGQAVDFRQLNLSIFGREPEDPWLGNYIGLYTGYAADYNVRYYASSGGLITALLIYAMEEGIINGALVTRMDPDRPLEPRVIIARNREEVISAGGSKYCMVPANTGLKEIIQGEGKFAVVGLPCHIHGIRKLELVDKRLKDKIVLRLGLMCSNNATLLGTEYFLGKHGVKVSEVKEFAYRRGGWLPKKELYIKSMRGDEKVIRSPGNGFGALWHAYLDIATYHRHFVHTRCIMCCDHTSELSDISFGDARLPEMVKSEEAGQSLVVTRTQIGEQMFQKALSSGRIELYEKLDTRRFHQAQHISYKLGFGARLALLKRLGKAVPEYNTPKLRERKKVSSYLDFFRYFPSYLASKRYLWSLLYFVYTIDFVNILTRKSLHIGKELLLRAMRGKS